MKKKFLGRLLTMLLVATMVFTLLPASAIAAAEWWGGDEYADDAATQADETKKYEYNIFFLDCGRKYYSVDSIKQFIDNASAAGFNYIQLAVGNDGLRFLLDDMSLTVNGTTYSSDSVKNAIQDGNQKYNQTFDDQTKSPYYPYNPETNELTQSEMDTIIDYANSKGMGVIPCVNTPGHMDAILSAATSLTNIDCSYNGSVRTIDVSNSTAVAFTKALLQKYIAYFADKGCKLFNMGADEYANDIYSSGSMGFGNLQTEGHYGDYVTYVNQVAKLVKNAGMTPMAFNDGIYYNNVTNVGTFDTNIIICYWSNGWSGYTPLSASSLVSKGFKLVNTNGSYYWVLGKTDAQCSADKASGFSYQTFPNQYGDETIPSPVGSMFCIWADYPGAETESSVLTKTAATIAAFGKALPNLGISIVDGTTNAAPSPTTTVGKSMTLTASEKVTWTTSDDTVLKIESADADDVSTYAAYSVIAKSVIVTPLAVGSATITAENSTGKTASYSVTVNAQETKTITVAENSTFSITVDGSYEGPFTTENGTVATVATEVKEGVSATPAKVTSEDALVSGGQYLIESARAAVHNRDNTILTSTSSNGSQLDISGTTSTNAKMLWTITKSGSGYTVANGDNYLTVGNATSSISSSPVVLSLKMQTCKYYKIGETSQYNKSYWAISYGDSYLNLYGGSNATVAGGYSADAISDAGSCWNLYRVGSGKPQTTITFTGVKEGTTTVEIGGVLYTINVISQSLADVDPLTIEYWITNRSLKVSDNCASESRTQKQGKKESYTAYYINIPATTADINSADGLPISQFAPSPTTNLVDSNSPNYVFWLARMLNKATTDSSGSGNEEQTADGGDDNTLSGTEFTKIRYYDGTWSVYDATNNEWVPVTTNHQLVAYYMQRTEVTQEVTTDVVDWGGDPTSSVYDYLGEQFVFLDFAVKYESGELSPDSFPNAKTVGFHCENMTERPIGRINAVATDDYEVYMITVRPNDNNSSTVISGSTMRDAYSNGYSYSGTEKVIWVDDIADIGDFADESLHAEGFRVGGEAAIVDGITISKGQAMLITYYVRAKASETSLTVRYVDSATGDEFYSYNIVAGGQKGDTEIPAGIGLPETKYGNYSSLTNGAVKNSLGKTQYISSDLSTMPKIGAQYRYVDYTCVNVERSDDGKTVTLYYTFNAPVATFVADFGLPVTIEKSNINANLAANGVSITKIEASGVSCGKVSTDNNTVTYTPDSRFAASEKGDTFTLTYTGRIQTSNGIQESSVAYRVTILPASNVLYEESFLTKADGWTNGDSAAPTTAQETQKVGDTETTYNVFGYDNAYKDKTGASGYYQASDLIAGKGMSNALTTEFYGNGFDLIGNCGPTTGRVFMLITSKDGGKGRIVDVDTRYTAGTLSQVPLAHVELNDGHYAVKIYAGGLTATTTSSQSGSRNAAVYASSFAVNGYDVDLNRVLAENGLTLADVEYTKISSASTVPAVSAYSVATYADTASTIERPAGTHVEIDGFRVYRSTTDDVAKNYPENEQNVKYVNILDAADNFTAFVEGSDKDTEWTKADEYELKGGPQNEIYLRTSGTGNGSAVTFKTDVGTVLQISARAVENGKSAKLVINGTTYDIASNTEMYYTVTANENGIVTIKNTGDGMLALGNLKVKNGTTVQALSEEDYPAAIALLNETVTPAEPEQPTVFVPEHFSIRNYATPLFRHKLVTLRIDFSKDVSYVEIDGQKYYPSKFASWFGYYTVTFTDTIGRNDNYFYKVVFFDANGNPSETQSVYGK